MGFHLVVILFSDLGKSCHGHNEENLGEDGSLHFGGLAFPVRGEVYLPASTGGLEFIAKETPA